MYRYKSVLLILLLGVVPVVALIYALFTLLDDPAPPDPVPLADLPPAAPVPRLELLYVAATDLDAGTLLSAKQLHTAEFELGSVGPDAFRQVPDEQSPSIIGHLLIRPVPKGDPLLSSYLLAPGSRGFLAAVLRPDHRALPVQVDPALAQSRLIDPGDRIDVILAAPYVLSDSTHAFVTRTIIENARVLAVDTSVTVPGADSSVPVGPGSGPLSTVTLELTPLQVQLIVLARSRGTLSLSVRSLRSDRGPVDRVPVFFDDLLLPAGDPTIPPAGPEPPSSHHSVRILLGDSPPSEQLVPVFPLK